MSQQIPPPPKKMVSRNVAIGLGIICIILIAGLSGVMAYYVSLHHHTDSDYDSLTSQNTNLQNQINQLQTWLNGNETLLNQTQTWLSGNITSLQSQINSLTSLAGGVPFVLSGGVEPNLANSTEITNTIVVANDQTVTQGAGYLSDFSLSASYPGYVSVYVQNSTVAGTWVQLFYSDVYGFIYAPEVTVNVGNSAVFPVLPSNITIGVGNGNTIIEGGASEIVTIAYYY
jgi:hypothetical protein